MAKTKRTRYWIKWGDGKWEEVGRKKFVSEQRGAGFFPKSSRLITDTTLATGGFSSSMGGGGIQGKITTHERSPRRRKNKEPKKK